MSLTPLRSARVRLVHRKLFDVRRPLHLDAGRGDRLLDPGSERVELRAGLPEVDDPPAPVDRSGGVKQEPLRWIADRVHMLVDFVELLLGHARELDADTDCHLPRLSWLVLAILTAPGGSVRSCCV